jgi:ribonuclease P protein component
MATTPQHTLPKAARLKSRKLIEELFKQGKGFTAFPVKVVYSLAPATNREAAATSVEVSLAVKAGVSVSSRIFKHATDRNRIKRLLREAYRQQQLPLQQAAAARGFMLTVFFIYVDKPLPAYPLLQDKMRYCLKRLRKIVEEQA